MGPAAARRCAKKPRRSGHPREPEGHATVMDNLAARPQLDVSGLPNVVFGHRNLVWLGTVLYILIEGTMAALLVGSYFYLRTRSTEWPPGVLPPALRFGVANTIVLLASVAPAWWVRRPARAGRLG